jgi:hypothetical protein
MRVLDIRTDLGPGARPSHLEEIIRGIRVAADVAYDAESRRARRTATEQMKYPTDRELQRARGRFGGNDEQDLGGVDEQDLRLRIEAQLAARDFLRTRGFLWKRDRPYPPEYAYEDLILNSRSRELANAGYDRLTAVGTPFSSATGLEVLDPVLYGALVADELARSMPEPVGVRSLRYENPFWTSLFGKGAAEQTVSTTAQLIEVVRDFGPKRTTAKADAAVAEATVDNRIAESDLDVALKEQELIRARLLNERIALENERAAQALSADQQRRRLVEEATRHGQLDIADALRTLSLADAQALSELGHRRLEIEEHSEADDS